LTAAYIPSLTIIDILLNSEGINLDDRSNKIKLNGFLFDMNHFFQTLLLRLLTDNLEQYTVKSEYKVNSFYKYDDLYNPKNRRTPTLRPDYMIFSDKNIISILDAKYIDLWDRTIDSKVLYQLTVYSLLYKDINRAIILYPSIGEKREQRINLNDVTLNGKKSQILIRYVDMEYLTELISNKSYQNKKKLIGYVNELVFY
jgi:5-methylcytosine-specific restriction enzyme subunit McrC